MVMAKMEKKGNDASLVWSRRPGDTFCLLKIRFNLNFVAFTVLRIELDRPKSKNYLYSKHTRPCTQDTTIPRRFASLNCESVCPCYNVRFRFIMNKMVFRYIRHLFVPKFGRNVFCRHRNFSALINRMTRKNLFAENTAIFSQRCKMVRRQIKWMNGWHSISPLTQAEHKSTKPKSCLHL